MIDDSVLWNDWYIVAAARDLDDERHWQCAYGIQSWWSGAPAMP